MNWTYNASRKIWTGSRGTGLFAVQKGRQAWHSMRLPFAANPIVLGSFATKAEALADAERAAR